MKHLAVCFRFLHMCSYCWLRRCALAASGQRRVLHVVAHTLEARKLIIQCSMPWNNDVRYKKEIFLYDFNIPFSIQCFSVSFDTWEVLWVRLEGLGQTKKKVRTVFVSCKIRTGNLRNTKRGVCANISTTSSLVWHIKWSARETKIVSIYAFEITIKD
jgi:hypothetical protein